MRHSPKMTTTTTTAASNLSIPVGEAARNGNNRNNRFLSNVAIPVGKAARSDNNNDITATTNLSIPVGKAARNGNNRNKHLISNVAIPVGEDPQKGCLGLPKTSVGFNGDFLAKWGVSKPYSNLYNF